MADPSATPSTWTPEALDQLAEVPNSEWPNFEVEWSDAADRPPLVFTDAEGRRWDTVRHEGTWKKVVSMTALDDADDLYSGGCGGVSDGEDLDWY